MDSNRETVREYIHFQNYDWEQMHTVYTVEHLRQYVHDKKTEREEEKGLQENNGPLEDSEEQEERGQEQRDIYHYNSGQQMERSKHTAFRPI